MVIVYACEALRRTGQSVTFGTPLQGVLEESARLVSGSVVFWDFLQLRVVRGRALQRYSILHFCHTVVQLLLLAKPRCLSMVLTVVQSPLASAVPL